SAIAIGVISSAVMMRCLIPAPVPDCESSLLAVDARDPGISSRDVRPCEAGSSARVSRFPDRGHHATMRGRKPMLAVLRSCPHLRAGLAIAALASAEIDERGVEACRVEIRPE